MDRVDSIDELYQHFKQIKQRMETLENENLVLRAQLAQSQRELADLRRGVGITVLIDGQPIAPANLPAALPIPVAALHTTPPAAGLFNPPGSAAAISPPGALFGPRPEQRAARPDGHGPSDWVY